VKKILIVVDMQNDFIDGALGTPEAVAIVPKVIKKIQNFNGSVLFTQDTHEEDYLETQEGMNLPVLHCLRGTKGWKLEKGISLLADQLVKNSGSKIFQKDTFASKELAQHLEKEAKTEIAAAVLGERAVDIEIVGLCTDICVISNALMIKGFLPEVRITVDASCCAGVTPKSHRNALDAMKACQIQITNEA
jgi:nicotinamidase/pyrazinamidase